MDGFLGRVEGFEVARKYFRAARAKGRLAHAYLFTGPTGAGKRVFVRLLAKALFCPGGGPCGECPSCRAADGGNHPAIQIYSPGERRAAIDIEEVRELGMRDRHRRQGLILWIIEDAERLSAPATNALLKTLEEPSPGTILILTAPSSGSLLPTIVSRCQRLHFPGPAAPSAPSRGEEDSGALLAAVAGPRFFADHDPRAWLQELAPAGASTREAVVILIDRLLLGARRGWPEGESAGVRGRLDPLPLLEHLLALRGDLDGNVNADLVLEALIRRLRENPGLLAALGG